MNKNKLKNYGLGLGLRRGLRQQTLDFIENDSEKLIQWLEIVPENYIVKGGLLRKQFEEVLKTGIPLIPHGVNLSIGTAPEPGSSVSYDSFLIQELKKLFAEIKPPWFSDHLSVTRINGRYCQDLIPLPRTQETVDIVSNNVKFLQDEFQLTFLIENPSYYSKLIPAEMSEAEFINRIADQADCGVLLDVNNIFVNSINHDDYNYKEFLAELDLSRVVQVHIAGHDENYHAWLTNTKLKILDTHGSSIRTEVYDVLDALLAKTEVNAILLERDTNLPAFDELVAELRLIKNIERSRHPEGAK